MIISSLVLDSACACSFVTNLVLSSNIAVDTISGLIPGFVADLVTAGVLSERPSSSST